MNGLIFMVHQRNSGREWTFFDCIEQVFISLYQDETGCYRDEAKEAMHSCPRMQKEILKWLRKAKRNAKKYDRPWNDASEEASRKEAAKYGAAWD